MQAGACVQPVFASSVSLAMAADADARTFGPDRNGKGAASE